MFLFSTYLICFYVCMKATFIEDFKDILFMQNVRKAKTYFVKESLLFIAI